MRARIPIALTLCALATLPACRSGGGDELETLTTAYTREAFPNPEYLTIVTWNVASDEGSALREGLRELLASGDEGSGPLRSVDLVALQEAPGDLGELLSEAGLGHARKGDAGGGGLVTAARVAPSSIENVADTDAFVTEYPLADGRTLLVANVLGTSQPWLGPFEDELERVLARLEDHDGPVVLCGDLRTFNQRRRLVLDDATYRTATMRRARPVNAGAPTYAGWFPEGVYQMDPYQPLVHVYYHGLFLDHCAWRTDVGGAPQAPLYASFRLPPLAGHED